MHYAVTQLLGKPRKILRDAYICCRALHLFLLCPVDGRIRRAVHHIIEVVRPHEGFQRNGISQVKLAVPDKQSLATQQELKLAAELTLASGNKYTAILFHNRGAKLRKKIGKVKPAGIW